MDFKVRKILPLSKKHFKISATIVGIFLVVAIILTGSVFVYIKIYEGKVYQGVFIGNYQIGGLSRDEVKDFIEQFNNRLAREGIGFDLIDIDGKNAQVRIATVSSDGGSVDLAAVDAENTADQAMLLGREGGWIKKLIDPMRLRLAAVKLSAPTMIEKGFADSLKKNLADFEENPHNATVKIIGVAPLQFDIIPERAGKVFDYENIVKMTSDNLSELEISPIKISRKPFIPDINSANVNAVLPQLSTLFGYDYFILQNSTTTLKQEWVVSSTVFSSWIETQRLSGGNVVFALNPEKTEEYLGKIKNEVDTPAREARFVVENGRVQEIQDSQQGLIMNLEQTYLDINEFFAAMNFSSGNFAAVNIAMETIEPQIRVSDLNALGITEIIGVGTSTFKDSHTNRIKNIAHAVERLNGILIKPGEEFSTLLSAGPFDAESGYLPEAVIKGREIKNEIGGGMCQIGTTLFRMAMNSGMPIIERRNHSLVVNYYADPVNGNPGTDATVYDPNVDFKFLNDTGNYLLLQTKIDYKKQMLTFTLWGKNDGRKGWYSHPKVSKWFPAGEPEEAQVTTLKPGEKKCQAAFRGAAASFIYTRTLPSGEIIERVFNSYYRPLPQICMVGAEAPSPDGSAATSTEQQ